MSMKSIGLGAAYRWFGESLALCRAHPRVLFGAGSLLLLVALIPTVLQLLAGAATQSWPGLSTLLQVVFSLTALVLMPPTIGGFYRIVQALDQGRPAQVADLFAVFKDAPMARRLIIINLIFLLVLVVLVLGLAMAFGGQELLEFFRTVSQLKPGADAFPPFPSGALVLTSMLMILALLISTAKELASLQVVLADHQPWPATGDGLQTTLRGAGALLLFYLPMAVVGFIVMLVFGLLAALIMAVLSLVSPAAAMLVVVPLALLLVLVLYALMFAFFYHAWRDTLGEAASAPTDHQFAA